MIIFFNILISFEYRLLINGSSSNLNHSTITSVHQYQGNHLVGHQQILLVKLVKMVNNLQTPGPLINKTNKKPVSRFLPKIMVSNHKFLLRFLNLLRIRPINGSPKSKFLLINKKILSKHPLHLFRLSSSNLQSSSNGHRSNNKAKCLSNR